MKDSVDQIAGAIALAFKAHAGQERKYTGEPYTVHLAEVASIVQLVTNDPDTIAAAWLHDVLEDTNYGRGDIEQAAGMVPVVYVEALTDTPTHAGNRAQRKGLDRLRLSMAPPAVQTIKLADMISNTRSIKERDSKFWEKTYRAEKVALLSVLTLGSAVLHRIAWDLVK